MKHLFTILVMLLWLPFSYSQSASPFIHLDQFGYTTTAEKVAVISDPAQGYNSGQSYTPGSLIEVRNAQTEAVVLSIAPESWKNGQLHEQSGDRGWWVDFSALTTEGEYYLQDVQTGERSGNIVINDDVYRPILETAGRMFFYNRCSGAKESPFAEAAWADGPSFSQDEQCRYIYEPNNATLEKDLSGGWFDAGDYNKYVTFAHSPIHDLLWAYTENPGAFGDDWNIPASNNTMPDLLDEVKWELDWLMKMNNPDGSTHIKMGSSNFSDNTAAPPSANSDPRYYGPTCTAASIAVASMFAHSAIVFEDFILWSGYVEDLAFRAIDAFDYALPYYNSNTLEFGCDDGSIIAGDADWDQQQQTEGMVIAAVYLLDLTANPSYNDFIVANYQLTEPFVNNFWGPYKMALQDALLHYTTLPGRDEGVASTIRNALAGDAANNWNDFFGFSDNDLYRAQIPNWSYHWGSNQAKAHYGNLNNLLVNYGIEADDEANFRRKASEQLHYFHGCNPVGLVYLSNMYDLGAERSVDEIYHTWFADGSDWDNAQSSTYGPPPGFVSGGPNASFSVTSISPPSNQPLQKSYLDFNTSWPDNSWEISEPAIYYQAAYIRLLANFVAPRITSTEAIGNYGPLAISPNPATDIIRFQATIDRQETVWVWNAQGQLVIKKSLQEPTLDISTLASGSYWITIGKQVGQFIKQ